MENMYKYEIQKRTTQEFLDNVLRDHHHYLMKDCDNWEGMRAVVINRNLSGLNFHGENLKDAIFDDCNISDCCLDGVNFDSAAMNRVKFNKSCIIECNFTNTELVESSFVGAYGDHNRFTDADLHDSTFDNAKLAFSDFSFANMHNCFITNACFYKSNFSNANMGECSIFDTDFTKCNVSECTFLSSSFVDTIFPMVDMNLAVNLPENLPIENGKFSPEKWVENHVELLEIFNHEREEIGTKNVDEIMDKIKSMCNEAGIKDFIFATEDEMCYSSTKTGKVRSLVKIAREENNIEESPEKLLLNSPRRNRAIPIIAESKKRR